jgi:hypothetical protein
MSRPQPEKTHEAMLARLCCDRPELDRLLKRLQAIAPVARRQQTEANRQATRAYFEAKGEPESLLLHLDDWIAIDFPNVDTPEMRELRSIGLAVAAFGGSDAISLIGWALRERGSDEARAAVWVTWDGMAGHWL